MDFGAPVADQMKPGGVQTLSQMMGLIQQGQQIGLKNQALATGANTVALAQQTQSERQAALVAAKTGKTPDGQSLLDANGHLDPVKYADAANQNWPLVARSITREIIGTQTDVAHMQSAINKTTTANRAAVSGILRAAINTPTTPTQLSSGLMAYGKENPGALPAILSATKMLGKLNPNAPIPPMALAHLGMSFEPPQEVAGQQSPQMQPFTTPSGELATRNLNPFFPGGVGQAGQPAPQGVSPTVVTPPSGIPTSFAGSGEAPPSGSGPGPVPTAADWAITQQELKNLNTRVEDATNAIPRLERAESALKAIHSGGGSEAWMSLAQDLQAIDAPKALVNAVGLHNLDAAQEAQKYLFQSVFSGLRQAMGSDPIRVAEFQRAEKLLPNVGTSPGAAQKLMKFMVDQGQRDYAEQQWVNARRKDNTFNPVTWQADYQKSLREGTVPGTPKSQIPGRALPSEKILKAYADTHFGGNIAHATAFLKTHGYE